MTADQVRTVVLRNIGKRVRIIFTDGLIQVVDIGRVDDEGFLHSGPDGLQPEFYWTRFDSVCQIESVETA
jgi:hypothetical protein